MRPFWKARAKPGLQNEGATGCPTLAAVILNERSESKNLLHVLLRLVRDSSPAPVLMINPKQIHREFLLTNRPSHPLYR
jgi:hypothetical protein